MTVLAGLLGAFLSSLWLAGRMRSYAVKTALLDRPTARSSHAVPTPRGGGVAIVLPVCAVIVTLQVMGELSIVHAVALIPGAGIVAAAGFVDDRRHVPAPYRLAVHLVAGAWLIYWAGLPEVVQTGPAVPGILLAMVATVALAWMINLYNFMDGIDGIAGVEALTVGSGAALLLWLSAGASGLAIVSASLAAAALGFLAWNWPPAKIFMGDVGSGFLGFVFGGLAWISVTEGSLTAWTWLILLGAFIVDATLTLILRMLRGERVHEAHRSHAYQVAARRLGSHLPVALATGVVNLLWLLPLALLSTLVRQHGAALVVLAWAPLVACWLLCRTWESRESA